MKILFFLDCWEALSQLRHAHTQASRGSGRLRRAQAGWAASGSLRRPQDGSGLPYGADAQRSLRLGHAQVQLRAAQARQLGTAQCSSGALKRIRRAQDVLRRAQKARRAAQEGTDTLALKAGHAQARSGQAWDGSGMSACGSGTLRQVQASSDSSDTLRRLQKLSDRLRYARVSSGTLRTAQARSLRQAQDGTTHKHAQTLKTRSGRLKQQAQASTGSSRRSGRLKRAVRQARVAKVHVIVVKGLFHSVQIMPRPKMINSSLRSLLRVDIWTWWRWGSRWYLR
jgi:hypothetical protein